MLKGRESVKRLIGKRRRFLPNRESILSSPLPQRSLDSLKEKPDAEVCEAHHQQPDVNRVENGDFQRVNCPICGVKIRSDDAVINSHLDACLAGGRKRKLSQQTLFQLNFCSRPKVQVPPIESDGGGIADIVDSSCIDRIDFNADPELYDNDTNVFRENSGDKAELSYKSVFTGSRKLADDEEINNQVAFPSLPHGVISELDVGDGHGDDMPSEILLQTFIVGRKFADQMELQTETKLFLSRDPENVKDANAIKVLSADGELCKVVGFLPRELAQYLSPLMDKFNLSFEAHVTSIPKHPLGAAPVQIVCRNHLLQIKESCEALNLFKSLQKHAMHVVHSEKAGFSGLTRYQQNLALLIKEVLKTYSHILTDDEKTFLERLTLLSDDSQSLFARLYTRKGPWYRMSSLSYPEILDLEGAVKELSVAGYICSLNSEVDFQDDDLEEIINVLKIAELREIASILMKKNFTWPGRKKQKKCIQSMKKQDLIGILLSSHKKSLRSNLLRLILHKTVFCIRISALAESLIWRAERLFFLNGEQDLSSFLLVDLGIMKYPNYNCIQSDHIFINRSDLLSYEEAIEVAQIMDESLDINNSELVMRCIEVSDSGISTSLKAVQSSTSKSRETFLSCFSASWVYSKVVLLGISFLEHEQRYNDAIDLLKRLLLNFPFDRRRGYWTLRLSVDLEHVGRIDESLKVAEDALLDEWVRSGARVGLQRRVLRLGRPPRRWKTPSFSKSLRRKITEVHVVGRPLACKVGMRSIFYGEDGEQCGVEQLALQYYGGEGGAWQGVHTESGIWLTIFGILMWDVIFADVPNAFLTKFQTAPLDLDMDCFYESRKQLIEEVLEKVKDGMAEEMLILSWESHLGTLCRGVNWERHSLDELRAAVTCIGGACIASICRHLAQDYRSWSSGMPDLLLWRFHNNYKGEAKLVEVKGPRDRLSEQQRAWLLFLMDCGFNVEVCKVTPPSLE
ncbi:OLC1v1024441C1 [Oldenlandia corymbosa var. corymbosa]|uniref:Fanconi-associated nuclease n=1 Tax=Oldenlandia corymbosa var. corymbosa TaxID=529605 RepID=A0AAV1C2C6_OLDCO|nr:OLC1v1024441C1 [Oldenlandia corymbosa var. corymbosa]